VDSLKNRHQRDIAQGHHHTIITFTSRERELEAHEPDRRPSYVNQYPPDLNMSGKISATNLPVLDDDSQGGPSSRLSLHVENFTSPIGMCYVIINFMIHCLLQYHRHFASDLRVETPAAMTKHLSGTGSFTSSLCGVHVTFTLQAFDMLSGTGIYILYSSSKNENKAISCNSNSVCASGCWGGATKFHLCYQSVLVTNGWFPRCGIHLLIYNPWPVVTVRALFIIGAHGRVKLRN
jgi:hypothetical protein